MSDHQVPENNRYSHDDEWITSAGDDLYRVGITDYAQQQLGDVVYVELPEVGSQLTSGQAFGIVESVKAVSDLIAPVSGEVVAINGSLEDSPELVNDDCYGEGWLIALSPGESNAIEDLMTAKDYAAFVEERSD